MSTKLTTIKQPTTNPIDQLVKLIGTGPLPVKDSRYLDDDFYSYGLALQLPHGEQLQIDIAWVRADRQLKRR
ncbi:MAG: hypothetical protein ACLQUY_04155 [Ktedonobacterales bacterium]